MHFSLKASVCASTAFSSNNTFVSGPFFTSQAIHAMMKSPARHPGTSSEYGMVCDRGVYQQVGVLATTFSLLLSKNNQLQLVL